MIWKKRVSEKTVWEENVFARTDLEKIVLAKNIFVGFDKFLHRRNCRKKVEGKSQTNPGQKKLGQKLLQTLSKNRFKIQNNNPKNGAARGARRPIFGASAACGASVVVLNFVSVFCRNLLELLAELLAKFSVGLADLTCLFYFFDFFFNEKIVKKVHAIP